MVRMISSSLDDVKKRDETLDVLNSGKKKENKAKMDTFTKVKTGGEIALGGAILYGGIAASGIGKSSKAASADAQVISDASFASSPVYDTLEAVDNMEALEETPITDTLVGNSVSGGSYSGVVSSGKGSSSGVAVMYDSNKGSSSSEVAVMYDSNKGSSGSEVAVMYDSNKASSSSNSNVIYDKTTFIDAQEGSPAHVDTISDATAKNATSAAVINTISSTTTNATSSVVAALSGQVAGIYVSIADIENIISRIKKLNNNISAKWSEMNSQTLSKFETAWKGTEATTYISKVKIFDKKIDATIKALELLQNTYSKALSEFKQRSNTVKQSVDSI